MSRPTKTPPRNRAARESGSAVASDHVAVMAEVFGVLADPGRLRLLLALREQHERSVSDLVAETGIAQSTVSHALRLLRAHRVVDVRRDGRHAYYTITDDHVRLLVDATLTHFQYHEALAAHRDRDAG